MARQKTCEESGTLSSYNLLVVDIPNTSKGTVMNQGFPMSICSLILCNRHILYDLKGRVPILFYSIELCLEMSKRCRV